MTKKLTTLLFCIVTVAYFVGMALQNDTIMFICKPLLVTSLLAYFISETNGAEPGLRILVVLALVFSIAGDTLLMFANRDELFFLLGLSAFLLAYVFYIITFHKIKVKENIEGRWPWAIVVAIYYFFIISILMPHLAEMKIPVLVYGLVISFMLLVAMLLYDLEDNKTARYILTGAILFVVSDSVLAINKFYKPFETAGWITMITYISAQYLLVKGLVRYITSKRNF
ncbi:MAG: hypothetical protein BGN92_06650 [Sphingobacteriales bacterium 41-5]|nr:MAG: hypothetical protein BGN92_06650 [Sphingobacteriales bacterium 41-5]